MDVAQTLGQCYSGELDYTIFEKAVRDNLAGIKEPLFTINEENARLLFSLYHRNLPGNRQHYDCTCCIGFIEKYGSLVTIDEQGNQHSAVWAPFSQGNFFNSSIIAMKRVVEQAKVTGVFVSSEKEFGIRSNVPGPGSKYVGKEWTHLSGPNANIWNNKKLTAEQRMAELDQDRQLLLKAILKYNFGIIERAKAILMSEQFPGYEKGVEIIKWFHELASKLLSINHNVRWDNLIWLATANAPPGYCHLSNGMVGTLLEDLAEGRSYDNCRVRWAKKMHPLQYQRPQAAPTEGQINAAEKLVEKMGFEKSFKRRFAELTDLRHIIWAPQVVINRDTGLFDVLRKNNIPVLDRIPNQNITWVKFERDVLPHVKTIKIHCPYRGGYTGVVTAEDIDSPPIIQWDNLDYRNPVSTYVYVHGSNPDEWNLKFGWNDVIAVSLAPHGNKFAHHQKAILFSIKDCYDVKNSGGLALFPEIMIKELREARSVVEAYSKKGKISGRGNANGMMFHDGNSVKVLINDQAEYTLDRWE